MAAHRTRHQHIRVRRPRGRGRPPAVPPPRARTPAPRRPVRCARAPPGRRGSSARPPAGWSASRVHSRPWPRWTPRPARTPARAGWAARGRRGGPADGPAAAGRCAARTGSWARARRGRRTRRSASGPRRRRPGRAAGAGRTSSSPSAARPRPGRPAGPPRCRRRGATSPTGRCPSRRRAAAAAPGRPRPAGAGVLTGAADRRLAGALGHEGALGEDGALEAAYAVHGDAGHLRDLFRGRARPYTGLDVAGAEVALHLDLDLAEAGTVAAHGGAEPFVDRKRVLRAVRSLQHQPCAVIRDGHDTQFGHGDLPGGACRRHVRRCFR